MKLVLATNNKDKIAEIRACLVNFDLEILTSADFENFPDPPETSDTLEGNAEIKARAIAEATSLPALADDTGLEVAALDCVAFERVMAVLRMRHRVCAVVDVGGIHTLNPMSLGEGGASILEHALRQRLQVMPMS